MHTAYCFLDMILKRAILPGIGLSPAFPFQRYLCQTLVDDLDNLDQSLTFRYSLGVENDFRYRVEIPATRAVTVEGRPNREPLGDYELHRLEQWCLTNVGPRGRGWGKSYHMSLTGRVTGLHYIFQDAATATLFRLIMPR